MCALKERRPGRWTTRAFVPPAGFEPAHRASETRVTSTYRGVEHRAGIEPALRALQARALPLGDRCRAEPSLGVEPSPLAYQASVPRRGHRDGVSGEDRNRTGRSRIASAARPLGTCLPEAVPTRIELAYRGRQPRILTRGFRDRACSVEESNLRRSLIGRLHYRCANGTSS